MHATDPLLRDAGLPPLTQLRLEYRRKQREVDDKTFRALLDVVYNAILQKLITFRANSVLSLHTLPTAEYHLWKMVLDSTRDDRKRATRFLKAFQLLTAVHQPTRALLQSAAAMAHITLVFLPGKGQRCTATYQGGTTVAVPWPCST